jgi:prepilin-type processing-associated H-X9-DG protein/prepilin-type N-terminal cleavage/methylation domain-containing protein
MTAPRLSPTLPRRTSDGFTLVEILVSITIVLVLAALIFSLNSKMRTAADESRCASNLRQLQAANILYANENNGMYVPCFTTDDAATDTKWYRNNQFLRLIGGDQKANNIHLTALCPLSQKNGVKTGYGYNMTGLGGSLSKPGQSRHVTQAAIARPAESIAFMDGLDWQIQQTGSDLYTKDVTSGKNDCSYRHNGYAQVAFWDGHVENSPARPSPTTPRSGRS